MAGLLAGLVHTLIGPDHIAAVAPLAADGQKKWAVGFRWGIGHSFGAISVGAMAIALREYINVEMVSTHAETVVGITLIAIGLWGIKKAFSNNVHEHHHTHDDSSHSHTHAHISEDNEKVLITHQHTHAAFAVGVLHGFAGGAHILGVLPALALPTLISSAFYLLFFGIGTIAAMTGFATLIGMSAGKLAEGGYVSYRGFLSGCSALTICVGAFWIIA